MEMAGKVGGGDEMRTLHLESLTVLSGPAGEVTAPRHQLPARGMLGATPHVRQDLARRLLNVTG